MKTTHTKNLVKKLKSSARPNREPIKVKSAKNLLEKAAKKLASKPVAKRSRAQSKISAKKKNTTSKPVSRSVPSRRKVGISEKMRDAALTILDARKADEIVTIDLDGKSSVADYLIIASGQASRQVAAIAHYLEEAFVKLGAGHVRMEGLAEGNWVLVDGGDVIVHLFRPEVREYYNLESLWDKKVQ